MEKIIISTAEKENGLKYLERIKSTSIDISGTSNGNESADQKSLNIITKDHNQQQGKSIKNLIIHSNQSQNFHLPNLIKDLKCDNQYFVSYLDYAVIIGKWSLNDNNILLEIPPHLSFNPTYLHSLRLFNEHMEILLFSSNREKGGFNGRIRIDDKSQEAAQEINAVDVNQILFGTKAESLIPGWIKLSEERGTEIILPASVFNGYDLTKFGRKYLASIRIRNYIEWNATSYQAYYSDHRFINFNLISIPNKENDNAQSL
jgi:CRISPR-associated protein (TIGR03984 family)